MDNFSKLFWEARKFGRVMFYSHDDLTYSCKIEMSTVKGLTIDAHSGYKNTTPEEAFKSAIDKAVQFSNSVGTK